MTKLLVCMFIASVFFCFSLNAQILECVMVNNPNLGLQLAKYKFEKLRAKNGTTYNKATTSETAVNFTAMTELGIEIIQLEKKPLVDQGIEVYNAISTVTYKNGMSTGDLPMLCYDVLAMNKVRAQNGQQQSPITIKDW